MPDYILVRSMRKTVSISFDREGNLLVRAPQWLPKERIEELLSAKAALIEKHRQRREQDMASRKPEPTLQEQAALIERAKKVLPPLVQRYAVIMQVRPIGISITGARTRWGSCSSKGRVCFSWRLMQMPQEFIEYVVVHELAHLKELNHSPQFWAIVQSVLPDWKQRRALARQHEDEGS